jgi:hypothetical protein
MALTAPALPTPQGPASPAGTRRNGDVLAFVVGATVSLLPFLAPAGPGNTAPADLGMAASLLVALLWTTREHLPVKLPYVLGVTGLVLGGAVAAIIAAAPVGVGLVLAQDLFLLSWAAVLALGRHNVAILAAATHAWCRVAPVYACVMVTAYLIGLNVVAGVTAKDGVRAAYTFGDPNLAGNYLVVSLFMMAACQRPRSPGVRRLGYAVVVLAIAFTGSNGAFLTLLLGTMVCFTLSQLQRSTMAGVTALLVSALFVGTMVSLVMPRVDLSALRDEASGSIPLLRDSFGRSGGSTSERSTINSEGLQVFLGGDATGVGPARTKATLESTQAPYVKEAHNDYLATLLERGLIGAVGLLVLGVSIAARCVRLVVDRLPAAYAEVVPRAWLLVAIAPVMATAGAFYEVLHFRHLWTWLGIVAALVLAMQDARGEGR